MRVVIALLSAIGVLASERPAVSVCELLSHLDRFNRTMVAVRGELLLDSDQSFDELGATDCRISEGHSIISIVSPDSHFLEAPPAGYMPDVQSILRAEKAVKQGEGRPVRVYATVTGFLLKSEAGPVPRGGGGMPHHATYPAYLVISGIKDIKLAYPRGQPAKAAPR